MKVFFKIWLLTVSLLWIGSAQPSWGNETQVYYTYDPTLRLENIKTRLIPIDMTASDFLRTLMPPLPSLGVNSVWALMTKNLIRIRPSDLVASPEFSAGKTSNDPWIVIRVATG